MDNRFTKVMSQRTNKELIKIVTEQKDEYQEDAVYAAEMEIRRRGLTYSGLGNYKEEDKEKSIDEFFNSIDKNDIKKVLNLLREKLPGKCTKNNYQLTNKMLNAGLLLRRDIQDELQRISDLMREHLQIEEPIKILTINNIEAGKFEMINNLNCIFINGDIKKQNVFQKVAILAHEISHYYLMRKHSITSNIIKENELITEINAVYVGFGLLLLKGYEENEIHLKGRISRNRVGYINQKTIIEAIIQTAYLRKQKPQWIIENVSLKHKIHLHFKLKNLIKQYNEAKRKQ